MGRRAALLLALLWGAAAGPGGAQPDGAALITRWGRGTHAAARRAYPRPTLARDEWLCLDGTWEHALTAAGSGPPEEWDGPIVVPFPVESALSGVGRRVGPRERLWYRRSFEVPPSWHGRRVLLHFGAVDWHAAVRLNGRMVGEHRGGYDGFTFDVTDVLREPGPQRLVVGVRDPTDTGPQPRGKQVREPGGIWYTPTTGIWQTVWLEPVPALHVAGVHVVPDLPRRSVAVRVDVRGPPVRARVRLEARAEGRLVSTAEGRPGSRLRLAVPSPRPWSPEDPFLYDLDVHLSDEGRPADRVRSYFGLRSVRVRPDAQGVPRVFLNGKPLFQLGVLDQGYWPDGLYAAPGDEALRHDVALVKRLGFNMVRKHVKVEPERWYHHCDRLGLLVWQDMPSGFEKGGSGPDAEAARQYERELRALVAGRGGHPSIVAWIPFNEGWGQHDTARVAKLVRRLDASRLVVPASGWHDAPAGDVRDVHRYPGPAMPPARGRRAVLLGEFGGLGLPVEGHLWRSRRHWGYRTYRSPERLTEAYRSLMARLHLLVGRGLAGAVYTQLTDVEGEVNGLVTYDRDVLKIDAHVLARIHARVLRPPPRIEPVVASAEASPHAWRYTTERPAEGWHEPGFDASGWKEGPAAFGRRGTPNAGALRTEWATPDIWLRRRFTLDAPLTSPALRIRHDEDVEVWVNGRLVIALEGWTDDYLDVPLAASAAAAFRAGRNVLAVHCRQTAGGQYVDVGVSRLVPESDR